MKKFLLVVLLVSSVFFVSSCSRVPAGHVGVKVYLLGGDKGVDTEELSPGRYWIGVNEELHLFPTFQQNYVWTRDKNEGSPTDQSITFQTQEGLECNADVGITYHIRKDMVSDIFQKYRKKIEEITHTYMRNNVRDALVNTASNMPVASVYGNGKRELLELATVRVRKELEGTGIVIDKIYWVGSIRLPKAIVTALNKKIEANQRAEQRENELREAQAEAEKAQATALGEAKSIFIRAEAQAKANRIISESLTPNLIKYKQIEKWDGKLPQYVSDGSMVPLLNNN